MRPKIVIFRNTPIDVDIKMYNNLFKIWGSEIIVYIEKDFPEYRKSCGYSNEENLFTTQLASNLSEEKKELIFKDDSIVIFNGIPLAKKYEKFISTYGKKIAIIAERDTCIYNRGLQKFIKKVFPFIQAIRLRGVARYTNCFFAIGKQGVECYKKYGFYKNSLFEFMYCDGNAHLEPNLNGNHPKKLIYVGRFDYENKGVDILLNALLHVSNNYTIDFYGGYGKDADEIIKRISQNEKLNYKGTINQNDLIDVLHQYDLIIVPSRHDGWNLHNNLSINAGICSISSDQAGSQELIEYCGNGTVIKRINHRKLAKAISDIISDPEKINYLKMKTNSYSKTISSESVAFYFANVLEYVFINDRKGEMPTPPWCINKEG